MSEIRLQSPKAVESPYRSWGEVQIARMLGRYGLAFAYEQPVAVVDEGKTRVWYPDFHLKDQGILLEYCGRPHDPNYAEGMRRKETVYAANGLTVLMITPDIFKGPWPVKILNQLEGTLAARLETIRAARGAAPLS